MALSFLSGAGSASNAKYFDIRLNEDYIVFRGDEHEAASAHLKGTVVLCLSEPLSIKYLRLHLTGMCRIGWAHGSSASSSRKYGKERTIYHKQWSFREPVRGKSETMKAGNYEFPFDVVLSGSMPESVEGLHDSWITYRFKAEIGRKYAKSIYVRKPLRIIRSLDPSALELSHAMSVDNIWPNKIEYSISTPSKAAIFGTALRVDFCLVPLLKGLRVGRISSQFVESHEFILNPDDASMFQHTHKSSRIIVDDSYQPSESELEMLNEEAEGFQFNRMLNLPKTLNRCLQDTDAHGIKIRHKLKFKIQLHNPDGHTSELRATLPVSLFISPSLPIDDNNNIIDQSPESTQRAILNLAHQAPPLYGEHQFDQLYSELDTIGYRTPGNQSGPNTPMTSLSRNLSMENVAPVAYSVANHISPLALHDRLTNLPLHTSSAPVTPPSEPSDSSLAARHRSPTIDSISVPSVIITSVTGPATPEPSRRSSEEDQAVSSGAATPCIQFSQIETLSRVPSYSTAVRSNPRVHFDGGLPNYETVIAAGDSPSASTLSLMSTIAAPPRAFVNRPVRGSSIPESSQHAPRMHFPLHGRTHSQGNNADSEHRLRLLQARARC
ncbi:hypothetical protein AJ80_09075 [Polytolypa hystricis UAMH7299]|uniref:Carbon catabolite repressor D n=1 Tax=Polytolypa hystricis (strain UAMH7299) TaxID=1447883 RepID=A0A2B7WWM7_POLH7|nr:hypothetical protein AJ80_09075 [Polytolypa hystricis UAMH7299]